MFSFYVIGGDVVSESSLKIGSSIMMAMSVFALVVSVLWFSITEVMFVSDFLAYTGISLSDALAQGSKSAELWLLAKKIWGVELFAVSLLMTYITANNYKKGEKWSWYVLLVAGFIFWGSLIGYKLVIGYFQPTISSMTFIVGTILFILGITVPARAILGKKTTSIFS